MKEWSDKKPDPLSPLGRRIALYAFCVLVTLLIVRGTVGAAATIISLV
jgi:hypothetical protein